ncbi:ABC transporter, permease OppB domain protein [Mycobacterium xenopi 4042]|uniref:ABC transporter, permease OppB domain protein n=1 Tax=Mycobacterium xenopi 4042 TaxID=1299334 RepID=X8E0W2_MYCXE|nr:ABC transporter, permease OppB domain protein [Mycobacterium xenopi 3993]EUA73470.1 ABC transporter, permease OppB domain protein [Mycobacterium xenopi 4042]
MIRFLARRLLNYVVLLALASFLAFCLTSVTFHPLDSFIQRHPQPRPKPSTPKPLSLAWISPYRCGTRNGLPGGPR